MRHAGAVIVLSAVVLVGLSLAQPFGNPHVEPARGFDTPQVDAATRGKLVFEKRCTGCHAMEADREGPRLAGVFGRKAGSVPGFDYSAGLKNSGITWNEATLEKWLNGPEMMVPDTRMDFYVAKAQERSDLIAYLKQKSEAIR